MDDNRLTTRRAAFWLLILGLLLAAVGQIIFSFARDMQLFAFLAYPAGFLLLFIRIRITRDEKELTRAEAWLTRLVSAVGGDRRWQDLLVLFACGAVLAATGIAQSSRPAGDYWSALVVWFLGVLSLGLALIYLPGRSELRGLRARMINARLEILSVVGLTLLAFILRVIDLQNIPYPFAGDEGSVGTQAIRILAGQATNMFVSGWSLEPMLSFLPYAASLAIFGSDIFGLRIVAAVIGTLTIPALYLLARALFDKPTAWLSALLLTVMSTHIHFSRIAVNNIVTPFFACLVFWLVVRALETRKAYWFAAAGIAAGVSIYSYAGTRFVAILAGIYLLYVFATDVQFRKEWRQFIIFGLSAGVVLFPIAVYFWQHPDIAYGRLNQVGILQSGWLANEMLKTGEPAPLIFARLVVNSFLVFISAPALDGFWNSHLPLLDVVWAFFFALGLFFSLLHLRSRGHVLIHLWFWSVVVVAGALTLPPPQTERLTMAFPVVAIFIAFGIRNVARLLDEVVTLPALAARGWMPLVASFLAVTSLHFYFFEYTPKYYYTDVNSEVGTELGQYLATASRDAKVYFIGAPRMFANFPSIPYLSHELAALDVTPGSSVQEIAVINREAIFVALPEYRVDLDRIRTVYPGGTYAEVFRRTTRGEILYLRYVLPNRSP